MADEANNMIGQYTTPERVRIGYQTLTAEDLARAAKQFKDGKPSYGVDFLIPNKSPLVAALTEKAKAVAAAKLPGRAIYIPQPGVLPAANAAQLPFLIGDKEADAHDKREPDKKGRKDFMRGHIIFRAKGPNPPRFGKMDPDGKVVDAEAKMFYRGAWVWANVNFKEYEGTDNRSREKFYGVKAYLNKLVFAGDGERLGGVGWDDFSAVVGSHTAENPLAGLDA